MENFDMDADDQVEQENEVLSEKKPIPQSGIEIDALHGLLGSYSTVEMKITRAPTSSLPLQSNQPIKTSVSSISSISTPVRSNVVRQVNTPSAASFHARSNKAEIVVEHVGSKMTGKVISESTRTPTVQFKSTLKPYKLMYQTLHKRADAMNQHLEEIEDIFATNIADNPNSILFPVGESVQDEVLLVGRIVCDSAGQLNAQSIILEGSSRTSKNNRIRLDISGLTSYSLFPGQVIMVSGIYTNPECFHVKQLIDPPLIPSPPETKIKQDLAFLVASGPFLLAQGNFSALDELLRRAEEDSTVQALILLGPFIDERSSYAQNLNDKTYDQLFQEIMERIKECRKKTVVIPSVRDIHHDSVYPLNPFPIDFSHRESNILHVTEPAHLSIDGLRCSVTSTDILCHLSSEEISLNQTIDRMSRLVRHLFQQRNLYPLSPSHDSVSIEYEQAITHARLNSLPHLFITSSDLRPFIKFIDSVCAINIGRLVKNEDSVLLGSASGTYAKICLASTKDEDISQGTTLNDHLKIQILRL